jgi:hypothetical protein
VDPDPAIFVNDLQDARKKLILKNFGAPLATKFTYKVRLGGKRDVGSGTRPVQTQLF